MSTGTTSRAAADGLGVGDLLRVARHGWLLMFACSQVAIAVALVVVLVSPTTYRTEAELLLTPSSALTEEYTLIESISQLDNPSTRAALAQLIRSESIVSPALETAGLSRSEAPDYRVDVEPSAQASTVNLTVAGPDAAAVGALADAVVTRAVEDFGDLYRVYAVQVIDPPEPTGEADRSLVTRVAAAAVVGLAVGFLIALLRRRRTRGAVGAMADDWPMTAAGAPAAAASSDGATVTQRG